MKIKFLGAARTVTGSRFLVEIKQLRMLVDCGMFQGPRKWKEKNWEDSIDPASVDCVLLTHSHIDHAGMLPRFIKRGFRGPVYCTPGTADLLTLQLPDSGHLQEEDARYINKKGFSSHQPALPLYTEEDAREAMKYTRPVDFYSPTDLMPDVTFEFLRAGHILGSAMIRITSGGKQIVFTGDLGRPAQFITKAPDRLTNVDFLILESTYGNRLHQRIDVLETLETLIRSTAAAGGSIIVPAFAIGRAQELLYLLRVLVEQKRIPRIPIFLDSPMAIHAIPFYTGMTKIFRVNSPRFTAEIRRHFFMMK